MVSISTAQKVRFGELVVSFAYALKHHLRETVPSKPLPGVGALSQDENEHLPLHICDRIYATICGWKETGVIDGDVFQSLDQHARTLMDVCGGCERIKSSPIAVSYRAFMRQGIALNLLIWPWYLTQHFALCWSLPPLLIGTYFLIGIELIAEDIEDPFGYGGDDLPLDNICVDIKKTAGRVLDVQCQQKFTTTVEKPRIDPLTGAG
jgi:putative membrane protein